MDLTSVSLAGLAAVGIVNVVTFFYPKLDNKVKFVLSAVAAYLVIALVPVELGNVVLEQLKQALVIAFAASGTYKIASKVGNA